MPRSLAHSLALCWSTSFVFSSSTSYSLIFLLLSSIWCQCVSPFLFVSLSLSGLMWEECECALRLEDRRTLSLFLSPLSYSSDVARTRSKEAADRRNGSQIETQKKYKRAVIFVGPHFDVDFFHCGTPRFDLYSFVEISLVRQRHSLQSLPLYVFFLPCLAFFCPRKQRKGKCWYDLMLWLPMSHVV